MSEESIRKKSAPSEGLPGSPINWLLLGAVVYGWTDRREPAIDRAWWKTAGARFPWLKPQATMQPATDREKRVEEFV